MPTRPLNTLAGTLALVEAIGTDRAGALVDIWHHSCDPAGWETLTAIPLAAVAYAEFDDARPRRGDDLAAEMLHHRTMPGEGTLDCARFASPLAGRGYAGMISVEVLDETWRGCPVREFAAACHDAARRFFPAG
jgi:sugar phosphate isomerase/epimerase